MLDGQLSALEAPEADENFVAADIRQTPGEIVEAVVRTLLTHSQRRSARSDGRASYSVGLLDHLPFRTQPVEEAPDLLLAQVVAGALMLLPRTATFAAVAFFPVALNIFVITVALEFRGTPFITGPMLVGAAALLAWDWHRLRGIVTAVAPAAGSIRPGLEPGEPWPVWERGAYAVGTAAGLAVFAAVRSLVHDRRGSQFDPELCDLVAADTPAVLDGLDELVTWDALIAAEPALAVTLDADGFDAALLAIANFVDLKSPSMLGHAQAAAHFAIL